MAMYCPGLIGNALGQKCQPHLLAGNPRMCPTCGGIATLPPGTVVTAATETYTLASVLGIGGMGIVYKARTTGGTDVVIKELLVNPGDPDAQRRFRREADIQAMIHHQAFPAGYGYFHDQGREFMAMEFVEGTDLEKHLLTLMMHSMEEREALKVGIAVCDGLTVLHNFVDPATARPDPLQHRDIKPSNIIMQPDGTIKILDLGISRTVRQTAGTQARATRAGTLEYCSPQQVSGIGMSIRDDIYSLAATLFHLIMGNPFVGPFPDRAAEVDQLPPSWQPLFRRAVHNDSNLRPRSAEEFKQELMQLLPLNMQQQFQQPAAAPQPGIPAAVPGPIPAPRVVPITITWRPSHAVMINHGEYRRPIAGRVTQGNQPKPGVTITPFPIDHGAVGLMGNPGTVVHAGLHGEFTLDIGDVTVPVTVTRRDIEVVIADPNTGAELHRETVTIDRPWMPQRIQANANQAGAAVAHAAAAPFRGAARGGRAARQRVGQAAAAMQQRWRRGARYVRRAARNLRNSLNLPGLGTIGIIVFALLTAVGIAMDNTWIWTISLWGLFLAWRLRHFQTRHRRGRGPLPWRRMIMPRLTTAIVGTWLVILLAALTR
jgi:hypothetical protein